MNVLKPHVSLNVANVDASVAFYEKAPKVEAPKTASCCDPGCCKTSSSDAAR
jgi:hypothetical protein